jgi:uncharacterized RDD family membrane protein YckC
MTPPNAPAPLFEPAPLTRRLAAFCYDLLLLAGVIFSFTLAVVAARAGKPVPPGSVWFPLSLLAISAGFFSGFWAHGGQTVGMRTWRIRVVRDDGSALGWRTAIARFCGAFVSALPIGLGLWWGFFDADRRAWHDRWTRTRVVRTDARGKPNARAPAPPSSP